MYNDLLMDRIRAAVNAQRDADTDPIMTARMSAAEEVN